MKKILLPAILLAAALAVPQMTGCAARQSGDAALLKRFRQVDKNNDGKVSRDEFTDFMIAEAFALYDKKGDGFVTLEEFTAGGGTPKTFRAIDRSGKGKVTLADAQASKIVRDQMSIPFDEADADLGSKGFISFKEFVAFRKKASDYVR